MSAFTSRTICTSRLLCMFLRHWNDYNSFRCNRTIDGIAKLQYFSDCKSSLRREIAKEQWQTDYNFIYLPGGDSDT